jgi:uncharacterized protein (DUF2062 family)
MAPTDVTPTKALVILTRILSRQDIQLTPTSGADSNATSSLSGGAIAGVVIGCVAFLVIFGVIVYFVLRRRESMFKRQKEVDDKVAMRQREVGEPDTRT